MKKLLICALALLTAACSTDMTEDVAVTLPKRLIASFEKDSRIQLNEEGKTVWTANDLVSVFYKTDANQQWKFEGQTGARSAELVNVTEPEATKSLAKVVVLYPYSESYAIETESCAVTATLPAVQSYQEDSFGVGSSIMISAGENEQVRLKNVCGWLMLQLTGDGEVVKSIELCGNNNEQVAGEITINPMDATATLADSSTDTTVTLDCGEGVTLAAEATTFYIALPPQTFSKGITVNIVCSDDTIMKKSTNNEIVITRNVIQPMDSLSYEGILDVDSADIPSNEVWYTAKSQVAPYDESAFNGAIKSNEWDNISGKGVISFEGDLISIKEKAFMKCNNIISIHTPNSVTKIGDRAFANCKNLIAVTLSNNITLIDSRLFYNCNKLIDVHIPYNVKSIRNKAFESCTNLKNITIPDSVTSIGNYAFQGCENLQIVSLGSGLTSIGEGAFAYCNNLTNITIPDSVTEIGDSAFKGYSSYLKFDGKFSSDDKRCLIVDGELKAFISTGLAEYTISNNVTKICAYACMNCHLESITIPSSVIEIGQAAFCGSTFKNISMPNSVKTIGETAFMNCSNLTKVSIPDSVTDIGERVFQNCSNLTEFNGKFASADKRCLIVNGVLNSFAIGCGLTEYAIPNSVTEIGWYAFYGCSSLTSVTIPDCVVSIGESSFSGCTSLSKIKLSNSVRAIGSYAFSYSNIENLTIPKSIVSIDNDAFSNCTRLAEVFLDAICPPTISTYGIFNNTPIDKIYVFKQCVDAYKYIWNKYSDNIVESDKIFDDSKTTTFIYTTTDGNVVDVPGLAVKSNTYKDGIGTLVVYQDNLFVLSANAFAERTTLKTITIPDGITSIGSGAFNNCSNLDSVDIPSSVTLINSRAFESCKKLTNITIPDSVTHIGTSAFNYCRNLKHLIIGNKVEVIDSGAFSWCDNLASVTIPTSVTTIGDDVFGTCVNLSEINGKFSTSDKRCLVVDDVLKAFAPAGLATYTIPNGVKRIGEGVFGNHFWMVNITIPDSVVEIGNDAFAWCENLKSIYCKPIVPPVLENKRVFQGLNCKIYVPNGSVNAYKIAEYWDEEVVDIVPMDFYQSTDYSQDGAVTLLQRASKGNGIDVVLMGDGYSDRQIADGTYASVMQSVYEKLFSEEPYKSHKSLFNVYYVTAVSATEGYEYGNTAFNGWFGDGSAVGGSDNNAMNYALNAVEESRLNNTTIVVMMNSDRFAGTCYMYYPDGSNDYGSGVSVSYFPVGTDEAQLEQLLHHEACGHGFTKLADEYAYENMGAVPANIVTDTQSQQAWGWWKNVDFTSDTSKVLWSKFIADERYKYDGLGAFEGGMTYWTGVWRPTENSIMRHNTGGFNAPSREAIYYRIHKLAYGDSWEYNYEKFVEYDAINRKTGAEQAAAHTMVLRPLEPTAPPVVVGKTWREALKK